ncbi:nitrate reductase [Plectosphaerella cucumerina]|uniref:Nitrate reductase n=1 Tax=Plectosphaerella cucumerina TaxID=40658 RepID=A0A8K0TUG9_9PEZI|nr:nitrate reductase [Plectosphaerella cucumerina]
MAEEQTYTAKEVAAHNTKDDCWMVIQGQVYDVTKYIHDHPGGADILIEAAGKDATIEFDNAGHSEDAFEIMADFKVGEFKGAPQRAAPKPVLLKAKATTAAVANTSGSRLASRAAGTLAVMSLGAAAVYQASRLKFQIPTSLPRPRFEAPKLGFIEGVAVATAVFAVASTIIGKKLAKMIHFEEGGFMRYPPHRKMPKIAKPDPLLRRGWLDPSTYHALPLTEKTLIAPSVYRLVFTLPTSRTVLGLPIGQHVAIKADIDGKSVTRSYTPTSNNADLGTLELVIRCYPDGLLTGRYLANLNVGDEVLFRGPKGAMRYTRGLCKKMGMVAGGTGITPMFQLIRAICEDDRDTTEVSLVYANRTEGDILLREELDSFARRYPANFKLYYMVDQAPEGEWAYGTGFVTMDVMRERLPAAGDDAKVMLCGPPGMVAAAKKGLAELGFEMPGASGKMTDQVFCF